MKNTSMKTSMKLERNKLRNAIVLSIAVGAAFTGMAQAQDAQSTNSASQGDQSQLETIVVTGTRIKSQTMTSSSPVTEIDGENFTKTGSLGVEDLINQYPQLDLSFDNFENNPSVGYAYASLRELGPSRTLTLVNGRRMPGGTSEFTDLSIIPAALVQRVDVLSGGASAVYGADAVAGVVNFILNDEFEGVNINFGYSGYQHDNDNKTIQGYEQAKGFDAPNGSTGLDGTSKTFDLVVGGRFGDNGHVVGYLDYRKTEALLQGTRDYSACAVPGSGGAQHACAGSGTANPPSFLAYWIDPVDGFNGGGLVYNNGGFEPGANVYNFAPENYFQRPDKRYSAGFMAKYEVNEHFTPYAEAMFVDRKSTLQIAESGEFGNTRFTCNDAFLGSLCSDAGIPVGDYDDTYIYALRRAVEAGPRIQDTDTTTYRVTAGVKGTIAGSWTYDAYFLYGATHSLTVNRNDLLISREASAISGCDPNSPYGSFDGCVPWDLFHNEPLTQEMIDGMVGTGFVDINTQLRALSAYATGDLGFGMPWANGEQFGLVVGAEHRVTTFNTAHDSDSLNGNFAGSGGASQDVNASEGVYDYYGELALPLFVNDDGAFNRLDGSLGFRHSDYELSGGANTYKAGLSAAFLDKKLLVRGGYNRAIRAPSLNDLYYPAAVALEVGADDLCAGPNPEYTAEQCAATGVPISAYGSVPQNPAGQYYGLQGGNVNLKPEVADTYTFGIAYEPISNLNLAIDYYRIKIKEAISSIGYNSIQQLCMEQGLYCDLIHRAAGKYDLWLGTAGAPGGGYIVDLSQNVGFEQRDGIDLNASYGFDLGPGRMSASFVGTYVLKAYEQPLADVSSTGYECKGKINTQCFTPKWRHVANVGYSFDRYNVNLRWRYIGGTDYVDAYTGEKLSSNDWLTPTGGVGSYSYFDLSASANFGPARWTIGVNNIADKEPPFVGYTGGISTGTSNSLTGYDQVGRYFFTNLSFQF